MPEKQATIALDVSGVRKRNRLVRHFDVIREVCDKAAQKKIDALRVRFKTPAGINRTVLIDPITHTTSDDAYVRRELLDGFNIVLQVAYEEINPELTRRMKALL